MIRLSDVRYALRLWRWHPAMVVVAGLSLGLGGATTTMYGVVKASAWPSGARAHDVVAMLMAQSLKPIGIGVVLGVAGG